MHTTVGGLDLGVKEVVLGDKRRRRSPWYERLLTQNGITNLKYWLCVSDDEQVRRFQTRINDPGKRWKLSPMELHSPGH